MGLLIRLWWKLSIEHMVLYGIALIWILLGYWLGRIYNSYSIIPFYHETPLVAAPALTVFISLFVFGEYMNQRWGSPILHFSVANVVVLLCILLSMFPNWYFHLLFMAAIFVVFVVWDVVVMCDTTIPAASRHEVIVGHKYINLPTLVTLLLVGIYLLFADAGHKLHIHPHGEQFEQLRAAAPANTFLMNPLEIFVAGLIAFHLLVAGVSYLIVAYGRDGKVESFWSRQIIRWKSK